MHNFVLIGYGEIAQKAHKPAIDSRRDSKVVAIVDTVNKPDSIPIYNSLQAALDAHPEINAASVCTPQRFTLDYAFEAVETGLNVLVEKPPGDYTRLPALKNAAAQKNVSVYTAYHSTAPPGIDHIKTWVANNTITEVNFEWKESAKKWHPNQQWITKKDGMGVMDILFNPISVLVYVLPKTIHLGSAKLVKPSNWEAAISGSLKMKSGNTQINGIFAWDYEPSSGPQEVWTMTMNAECHTLTLTDGGAQVYIDGTKVTTTPTADYKLGPEYVNLYKIFTKLIREKRSYTDGQTPKLVDDILERGVWSFGNEYKIMIN